MKGLLNGSRHEVGVYERIAARGVEGGCIRPGGLALTERALSLCAFPLGSRILDVGCGTGATVAHLRARRGFLALGVDPSLLMIQQGVAGNESLPLLQASGECLPFSDGCLDGVLAECSLSLAADPGRVLRECRRVLKAGGKLLLSDVYARNAAAVSELRSLSENCCVAGASSRDEILRNLADCGFTVLAWEDHSTALKLFAAQLTLSHGSLNTLWCPPAADRECAGPPIEEAAARARLGYFLAVAEKSPLNVVDFKGGAG